MKKITEENILDLAGKLIVRDLDQSLVFILEVKKYNRFYYEVSRLVKNESDFLYLNDELSLGEFHDWEIIE